MVGRAGGRGSIFLPKGYASLIQMRHTVHVLSFPPEAALSIADEQLTIRRTATGYWSVQRGSVHIVGAPTRRNAEAERELLRRLGARRPAERRELEHSRAPSAP
jgi:hypothetical protein